jgi:RNA polymerase sigma-70 factor (TIGR02957 family)
MERNGGGLMKIAEQNPEGWNAGQLYQTYKPYLMAIAYRMLGSVSEAEDVVQDMFVSLQAPPADPIQHVKAYLGKIVTNRCLNVLKSAKKRKETYLGPWLPEPLILSEEYNPLEVVERSDTISYAFMILLESLSPVERAIYVLREAFVYDYKDIADMVDKSEANCRKIYSRAKKSMGSANSRISERMLFGLEKQLVKRFVDAFKKGAIPELMKLLTEDAVFFSDGGGKVRAAVNPIVTRSRIATLLNVLSTNKLKDASVQEVKLNGGIGLLFTQGGSVMATVAFDWNLETYELHRLYTVLNPDKLRHIRVT